jgi:hypothetical protein
VDGQPGFESRQEKTFFSVPQHSDPLREPHNILSNGYRRFLPRGQSSQGVKLATHLDIFIHSSMALHPFVGPWPLFQFRSPIYDRTLWTGDQPVARSLSTHRTTQTQNKRTQTSMTRVRFKPTTPVFEWAKTVHALDRAATVIGHLDLLPRSKLVELSLLHTFSWRCV